MHSHTTRAKKADESTQWHAKIQQSNKPRLVKFGGKKISDVQLSATHTQSQHMVFLLCRGKGQQQGREERRMFEQRWLCCFGAELGAICSPNLLHRDNGGKIWVVSAVHPFVPLSICLSVSEFTSLVKCFQKSFYSQDLFPAWYGVLKTIKFC